MIAVSLVEESGRRAEVARKFHSKRTIEEAVELRVNGGLTTQQVADKFGVPRGTINRWCRQAGAPALRANSDPSKRDWTEIILLLGTISDIEVGKRFNIPTATVYSFRRRKEIPAFRPRVRRKDGYIQAPIPAFVCKMMRKWGRSPEVAEHALELKLDKLKKLWFAPSSYKSKREFVESRL